METVCCDNACRDLSVSRHDALDARSISLVLPAWNEADAIARSIQEADRALRDLTVQYEIIVVDDGSDDGTGAIVQEIAAGNRAVRLVRHETNQGYGAALRSGFAAARCDLVVFTDADSQFDLTEMDRFLLLSSSYQIVCGYRMDRKDSALRCFYSRVYNQLVRCLLRTGVRDVDCAFKMFRRDVVQDLPITTNGFLVNSELLTQARHREYSIVEVGVSHRPRTEGTSTVSVAHVLPVLAALLRYWWNHVQFPGGVSKREGYTDKAGSSVAGVNTFRWAQGVLILAAALLLFGNLAYPLLARDETRYAEIPREMLATGNWVLPQLNFRPYYDKPALLYWLCATSYSLFGISEWSARLIPAASGMGTLLATMWFGNRILGQRTGLLAGTVLLLSTGFLVMSRALLIDGVLTFLTTVSLFAAYEAMRKKVFRWRWWTVASVACGLAFMAKGPVALVLMMPPVFVFGWLADRGSRPRLRHWALLVGIVFGIAAPWFTAVTLQHPKFAYEFFYRQNISRFAGAFHQQPFWYFIPVLLIACHPWSTLMLPYAGFLTSHSKAARQRRPQVIGYLFLWSAWCLFFFSISRCKLAPYIFPAVPAMALMIGHYLEQVLFSSTQSRMLDFARKSSPWHAAATTCVVGIGFGGFALLAGLELPYVAWGAIAAWAFLLVVVFFLSRLRYPARVGWSVCSALTLLLAVLVLHREVPRHAQARTVFGPGSPLIAKLSEVEPIPLVSVDREWAGIPFNLNRNDVQNFKDLGSASFRQFTSEHHRILFVVRNTQDTVALRDSLPKRTRLSTFAQCDSARLVLATITVTREDMARSGDQESNRR